MSTGSCVSTDRYPFLSEPLSKEDPLDNLDRLALVDQEEDELLAPDESDAAATEASDPDDEPDTEQEESSPASPSTPSLERLLEDQKRRNAGLQRKVSRDRQVIDRIEQRLAQLEEMLLATQLQGLPPAERSARMLQFRRDREMETRHRELIEHERMLEEKARAFTIAETARETGLDPALLERARTPDELYTIVQLAQQVQATGRSPARPNTRPARQQPARQSWQDQPRDSRGRFEPTVPSQAPRKEPEDLDEAAELFRQRARRLGL